MWLLKHITFTASKLSVFTVSLVRILPAFGVNTENTGKMPTGTIPNTDTFYAVYIK